MWNSYEEILAHREAAQKKFAPLVEHVDKEFKGLTAQMLDIQERASKRRLETDQTTSDTPTSVFPAAYAFPIITQVFPNLVATRLCQVQPMTAPLGKVFYKSYIQTGTDTSFAGSGSYANNTEVGTVRKGKLRMASADVSAEKFILQAQWSTEVQEDLRALANLDVEADLMRAFAEEIVGEIDWLILKDMRASGLAGTATAPAFGDYSYQSHIEHWNELRNTLIDADVLVSKKRFRRTNYIIGDPAAVAKVRKIRDFKAEVGGGQALGAYRVGMLDQWEVWETANYPQANELLMGIKGEGFVYAPYIPMELMNPVYVPATDEWVRNVRTRAARKRTIADSFALVDLSSIS